MRAILFDKDGTLIDFHQSWSQLYRDLGAELAAGDVDRAGAMLESGGMDLATGRVRAGSVLAAGNTRDIVDLWYPTLVGDERAAMVAAIDRRFFDNGVRYSVPVPGLLPTLATLADLGIPMAVATSDGTAAARAALDALGAGRFFTRVFGYDSVERPKPAPDMVHAFAAAVGVPPAEIAVVGDNVHDLHMARSAGAGAAVGVLTGTGMSEDLAPLADAVLGSICDLPAWLASRKQNAAALR